MEKITHMKEIKKRQPLYLPGDPSSNVYLLKRGRVKIANTAPSGKEVTFDILEARRRLRRSSLKPRKIGRSGAEEAQKIKSEAEKDREIILAEAYRESEELRGGGDAKAFRIYADAYRQDPHFFEFTRTMEAYRKTLKEKTTILVSPDSEFFRFLKQR